MNIVTYDEALQIVLSHSVEPSTEELDVWTIPERTYTIAEDIKAPIPLPPFSRAMMDGYAIHEEDISNQNALALLDDIHAGEMPTRGVLPGTAIKIRTGAPVPEHTAAVVRKEWTESIDEAHVKILRSVKFGESIQPAGEDALVGDILLSRGTVLTGQTRTILKAAGISHVKVYSPCKIGIISTGSELVTSARPIQAGQIYAASDAFIADTAAKLGAKVSDIRFVPDAPTEIERVVESMLNRVDYLFITGGASVGDTDFVRDVLKKMSGTDQLPLERVWMRPGAPFTTCHLGNTTVFGLSGNPAASFVQFHVLALHALRKTLGLKHAAFGHTAKLSEPIQIKPLKHVRFFRAQVKLVGSTLRVFPEANQSSGALTGLASTNSLIRLDSHSYSNNHEIPIQFTEPFTPFSSLNSYGAGTD